MGKGLFFDAIAKFIAGFILVASLIFIPAGTLSFTRGWILMCVLFVPMFFAGIVMMLKNPELLKERLDFNEQRKEQVTVVVLSGFIFVAGFIVAGLNVRFGWYILPKEVSLVFVAVFILSYLFYAEVLRENMYLFRTVKVRKNQKVIDNGLYGVIRHPMYCSVLVLFLSMPVILGSVYSFLIFLAFPLVIVKRIKNEEELLKKELAGYCEYMKKVKYRLIPFVW